MSQSRRLWGLCWDTVLPWSIDDVSVEVGTFADALPFIRDHYARIFGEGSAPGRFLSDPMTGAKRRFGDEMDVLAFRHEDSTVGLLMAHPLDWSTYYMRSVALLPEYRDRRLLTRLVERTFSPLREVGVERIEGDCAPTNGAMMRMLVGLGFLVTSTANSERWGAHVRFTKYLRDDAEDVFARQFCGVRTRRAKVPTDEAHSGERRTA